MKDSAPAWAGLAVFSLLASATDPPYWFTFELDAPVLLFVTSLVVVVTLISGVVPGLRVSGTPRSEVLKDQSRGAASLRIGRLTRGLVVAELALSLGMGLITRGWYYGVSSTDPVATIIVMAVLAATGIAALVIPARQATRVDPITALHFE